MKSRLALLVSLGAGLLALVAVALYLNVRERSLLELSALQDVVVANRDILSNTVIDERNVAIARVPQKYVQPGALTSMGDAVGRVAAVPIPNGSQITGTGLQEGGREALAFQVPRGMRAVTIAVSDVTGVAGLVKAGNFVDLVGIFEYGVPTGNEGGRTSFSQERTEALTLAQNVQVIAVGAEVEGAASAPRAPASGQGSAEAAMPVPEKVTVENMTLLVTPQQVQEIVLAQQVGMLTVSLRSNLDAGQVVDLPRLDPLTMLKVQTSVPVKTRPQPAWREIRGTQP
jgi:pilus assembly protein CpaB